MDRYTEIEKKEYDYLSQYFTHPKVDVEFFDEALAREYRHYLQYMDALKTSRVKLKAIKRARLTFQKLKGIKK